MNRPKLMKKPGNKTRKHKGWPKKLQGGCREKKKRKEKLCKRQLERLRKMQGKNKKKRKRSLMRSLRNRKKRG